MEDGWRDGGRPLALHAPHASIRRPSPIRGVWRAILRSARDATQPSFPQTSNPTLLVHQYPDMHAHHAFVRSPPFVLCCRQGDEVDLEDAAELRKKRTFRKFAYRGVDLDQLMDLPSDKLVELFPCRIRRRFARGLKRKPMALIKRLRKAKKETAQDEKPETIKTHLRNMIIVPEMIGSVVGVYNGKVFNQVEIKPEMVGFYLGEFSISYKPVKHGRPGIGATHSSRFIPLK